MKTISQEEWDVTHKDYKSTINGQKYVLQLCEKGTCLVPIKISKKGEIK